MNKTQEQIITQIIILNLLKIHKVLVKMMLYQVSKIQFDLWSKNYLQQKKLLMNIQNHLFPRQATHLAIKKSPILNLTKNKQLCHKK
jgi:hypothetical protein